MRDTGPNFVPRSSLPTPNGLPVRCGAYSDSARATHAKPMRRDENAMTMSPVNDVDEYGLPAGILGRHPDKFYGSVGRVVCVCAVLEDKVTTLRHTLARAQQGQYTQ